VNVCCPSNAHAVACIQNLAVIQSTNWLECTLVVSPPYFAISPPHKKIRVVALWSQNTEQTRGDFRSLLRRVRDFVFEVSGLIIAAKLAERCFVKLKQNIAQLLGCRIAGGEALSVNLAQCANKRVSVLVADFAIVIAVAIAETWLAHAVLHRAYRADSILPAGPKGKFANACGELTP
jgi:hypothetical protein